MCVGIKELSDAGVDPFNLYLMSGDEEAQLEAYGSAVIPALKAALARRLTRAFKEEPGGGEDAGVPSAHP